jgi:PAS domain S-box-containing protein
MGLAQLQALPNDVYGEAGSPLSADADRAEEHAAPLPFDRRLRILGDTAFEAFCSVDDNRRYLRANAAAVRVLGAPKDQIIGRRVDDFTRPEDLPTLEVLWETLRREGEIEGRYLAAQGNGSIQPVRFRAQWNYLPGEHLIVALETHLAPPALGDTPRLTVRELEILALAADGHSNQDIARRLVLSPATVKTHLQNTYRKLEVPDRAAAVAVALRTGLID